MFARTHVLRTCFLLLSAMPVRNCAAGEELMPGWSHSHQFDEQVQWQIADHGIRVFLNTRRKLSDKPRTLVIYATPNGSTAAHALGAAASVNADWKYQNQHVSAQIRMLREVAPDREWSAAVP